jgi:spore germination protein YaaH
MSGRHAAPEQPRAARRSHRAPTSRRSLVVLAVAAVLVAALAVTAVRVFSDDEQPFVAAAWLPTWDDRAADSLPAALDDGGVREVGPTWATVRADGTLALTPPADSALADLDEAGAVVLPVVQNVADGVWLGEEMGAVLADPDLADAHREALVEAAVEHGWDGVDLDYESLPASAGPAFVEFLTALRDALHERDLTLAVTVPARTTDEPPYDYEGIGAVADQVRVMAYDHSWSGSAAGPIAPVEWVREVVAYAVDRIPPSKLMLGVGTYGYDWVGSSGADLGAAEAAALADEMGASPHWDDDGAAMTFSYERDGQAHTVWYEDARSLEVKQQIAVDAGLRGVAVWRIGGEDPQAWATLGRLAPGGTS